MNSAADPDHVGANYQTPDTALMDPDHYSVADSEAFWCSCFRCPNFNSGSGSCFFYCDLCKISLQVSPIVVFWIQIRFYLKLFLVSDPEYLFQIWRRFSLKNFKAKFGELKIKNCKF